MEAWQLQRITALLGDDRRGGRRAGEDEPELRAAPGRRGHLHPKLQQVGEPFDDRQAEAESSRPIAFRIVELVELLEDPRVLGFGDSAPGVGDGDDELVALRAAVIRTYPASVYLIALS